MNKIDKFVSPNAKLTNAGQRPPEQNQGGPTAFGEASCSATVTFINEDSEIIDSWSVAPRGERGQRK